MVNPRLDAAVSVFFRVTIDGHDLGAFTSCEGLGYEVEIESKEEGGNNGYVAHFPGRVRYKNITLSRPINADSKKLATWFASMGGRVRRTNAKIAALTYDGKQEIASWSLEGVIPVRWDGPSFSADDARVVTETFEIAHHGFMPGA